MGANLNVKKWSRGFTSRQVEIIELESGEVLKNVATNSVATPQFSLDGSLGKLTITCATTGAILFYKKGSGAWTSYSTSISVAKDDVIKAMAVLEDNLPSFAETTITKVATPSITITTDKATVECETDGATIFVKVNDDEYAEYTGAVDVVSDDVVKAYATLAGSLDSAEASKTVE